MKQLLFTIFSLFNLLITVNAQEKYPKTNKDYRDSGDKFQFVIVPDRNGSNRPGIFEDAIEKVNMLQPELVLSVGDYIEGYTKDEDVLNKQWDEVNRLINKLEMPFYYVPGNHDYSNPEMAKFYNQKYGKSYYHFTYKNTLFLCLNSEGEQSQQSGIDKKQFEYFEKVLEENSDVRWTFVFMHQPIWSYSNTPYWTMLEDVLKNKKYTVFAGHTHQYKSEKRANADYLTLATVGGVSELRGVDAGEFDHLTLVTLDDNEPVIANILLEGMYKKDVVSDDMYPMINAERVLVEPVFYDDTLISKSTRVNISNTSNYVMNTKLSLENDSVIELNLKPNSSSDINIPLNSKPDKPVLLSYKYEYKEGRVLSYEEELWLRPLKKQYISKVENSTVNVDGKLKEWGELKYKVDENSAKGNFSSDNISFEFDISYDDTNMYVAMKVYDDDIILKPDSEVWMQNEALISFDARPISESANYVGNNIYSNEIFSMQFIPKLSRKGEQRIYQKEKFPKEMKLVTRKAKYGFNAELSLPISYLNSFNKNEWESLRFNIIYTDVDKDDNRSLIWWKPNWSSSENYQGSGTFFKNN